MLAHDIADMHGTVVTRHPDGFPLIQLSEVTVSERNVVLLLHRYRLDQGVAFFPAAGIDRKAKGQYTVVRLLPIDGAIPQYRVKNRIDGHERVVCENELRSL